MLCVPYIHLAGHNVTTVPKVFVVSHGLLRALAFFLAWSTHLAVIFVFTKNVLTSL